MMPKKKKIAQPATDTTIEVAENHPQVEYAQPEVEVKEPTAEERLELLEKRFGQFEKEVEQGFGGLVQRLTPIIQLSDELAQAKQQQTANPQQQPALGGGLMDMILKMFMQGGGGGGGDNELAELGNQYGKLVLKQAIDNIGKPSIQEQIGAAVLDTFVRKKATEAGKAFTE